MSCDFTVLKEFRVCADFEFSVVTAFISFGKLSNANKIQMERFANNNSVEYVLLYHIL